MRLTHQIGSLGSANIIYLFCQLGIFSLLAQLTDLETVAAFGFVMAIVQPFYMLLRMGLRANLATDAKREFAFATFLSIRSIASVLLLCVPVLIVWGFRPEYLALAVPIALMNAAESHSDLCYGALQRAGRVQIVARSMLIRGPLALVLFGGILYLTGDAEIAFWAQTVAWIGIQVFHDFPGVRRAGEQISFDRDIGRIIALLKNTWLLGLGQFFASLQTNVPRFLVEIFLGTTALAYFTAVSVLQRATVSLFNTLEQAIGWRLSQIWAEGDRHKFFAILSKMLLAAILIACCGVGMAFLLGKPFLALFFGVEYIEAYGLLLWFAGAIGLQLASSVVQTGLTAQRRFASFGAVQLVALIVTVPFTYMGLTLHGLNGAGMAICVVMLLRTVYFGYLLRKS